MNRQARPPRGRPWRARARARSPAAGCRACSTSHNTCAAGRARAWRRPRYRPAGPRASGARAGPPVGRPGRRPESRPSRPAPRPRRSMRRPRAAAGCRRRAPAPRPPRRAPPPAPRLPALRRAQEALGRPCGARGASSAMANTPAAARLPPDWPTRRQAGAPCLHPQATTGRRGTRAPPSAAPGRAQPAGRRPHTLLVIPEQLAPELVRRGPLLLAGGRCLDVLADALALRGLRAPDALPGRAGARRPSPAGGGARQQPDELPPMLASLHKMHAAEEGAACRCHACACARKQIVKLCRRPSVRQQAAHAEANGARSARQQRPCTRAHGGPRAPCTHVALSPQGAQGRAAAKPTLPYAGRTVTWFSSSSS